ncbi:hypothetical protein JTE90_009982 [Oedothorax gibbosus]|uniref:Uncharacterized protein n=1 Tax=Oedothorax gibbosus TaxID=931172 RepID=A0AAV6UFT4_9ARAC|nr:hypothetical protein JTE90_009982 [Oedothorax gibbosus]
MMEDDCEAISTPEQRSDSPSVYSPTSQNTIYSFESDNSCLEPSCSPVILGEDLEPAQAIDQQIDMSKNSKKRKRKPESWKKSKTQLARNSGEQYVSSSKE